MTKEYPYTYARVSAMKSKLLNRSDYDKLMKLSVDEIIRFLSENEYKKEIEKLGVIKEGIDLFESALLKNVSNMYNKLKKISKDEVKELIIVYLIKNDIHNIKTILRGAFLGKQNSDIKNLILDSTKFSSSFYEMLIKEEKVEKIMGKLFFLEKSKLQKSINSFNNSKNLILIENLLDHYMYDQIFEIEKKLSKDSIVKKYLRAEIQAINLKILLRLKHEGKKAIDIIPLLIKPKHSTIILADKSYNDIIKYMKETMFKEASKENNLLSIEAQIDKRAILIVTRLLHQKPLSADIIMGYLFAKEIEMRNLRLIIKAKEFKLDDDFVNSQLVVAK